MRLANWYYPGAGISNPVGARLRGLLEPSVTAVDKLWTPGPVQFDCETFANVDSMSICQVHFSGSSRFYQDSGSLLSEFWNITHNDTRTAVLQGGLALYSLPLLIIQSHKSSAQNLKQNVTGVERNGSKALISTHSSSWTVSICYSAWTTANLNVDMFSETNRSEPITHWNHSQGYYTIPDVHSQMGEIDEPTNSLKSRGVLELAEKTSWIPDDGNSIPNSVKPFVQEFADLNEDANLVHMLPYQCSPCTALLAPYNSPLTYGFDKNSMFLVDYSLTDLFHQSIGIAANGSWARAVSSLITTLSSMAYYDQMPQFQKTGKTSQVFFTTVLFPQSHLGFWVISIALAAHIMLVTLIAIGFMTYSRHTLLGNHWQTIAQLQDRPETEDLLKRTRMATDSDVKRALRIAGYESVRVGVRSLHDGRSVGLSAVRHRTRSTDLEGND